MSIVITTEIWYKRIVEKNKLKYDHSKAVYTKAKDKLEIICPKHGSFWQQADLHAKGAGCPECANENGGNSQRTTQARFITQSIEAGGEDYDHSTVKYKNSTTKVDIICPIEGHGMFSMLPLNRVRGQRCPKCARATATAKTMKSQVQFIEECHQHADADKLDFTDTVYNGDKNRVTIKCKEHGPFEIIASNFLHQGNACPDCSEKLNGYRHNLPGHVYVLSTDGVVKVGITNRTPEARAKEVSRRSGKVFSVVGSIYSEDGKIPRAIELRAHAWMAEHGEPVEEVFDGSTECFKGINCGQLICHLLDLPTTESE